MSITNLIKNPGLFLHDNNILCGEIRLGDGGQEAGWIEVAKPGVYPVSFKRSGGKLDLKLDKGGTPAYLLPWKEDGICEITLGTEAKVFFTAGLTGCRIFIRKPESGGAVVYHANGATKGSVTAANAHMNELFSEATKSLKSAKAKVAFGRDAYGLLDVAEEKKLFPEKMLAGYMVNFLGVLGELGWRFFCQSYYVALGKDYEEIILKEHSILKEIEY